MVLPCESGDGGLLVLKLTPDLKIAADEATALDAWMARRHVVTLHDADLDHGVLLLERVLPGTRLADEPGRWTLEEVAPVLSDLWRQPSWLGAGSGLPELRERAEFRLYGVERDDVDYIMETFQTENGGLKHNDIDKYGMYRTKDLILDVYDGMCAADAAGMPYKTTITPLPGFGPRHPANTGHSQLGRQRSAQSLVYIGSSDYGWEYSTWTAAASRSHRADRRIPRRWRRTTVCA